MITLDLRLAFGLAFFLGCIFQAAYSYCHYRKDIRKVLAMTENLKRTLDAMDFEKQETIDRIAEEIWEKIVSKTRRSSR